MIQPDFREPASFTDPPYEPDCDMCYDTRKVEVAAVMVDNVDRPWPAGQDDPNPPEVDCPWCAE